MILQINPNRMELLRLKKRIAIARRGHKLLKDKQDELMRKFMSMINEAKSLRHETENSLKKIFKDFITAHSINSHSSIDKQLGRGKISLEVAKEKERFLNLDLHNFKITKPPKLPVYNFFNTTSDLDVALVNFRDLLPQLIKLAEFELNIKLLAEEIKSTRRRVNALEYILIPNLVDTVKYINMKLAEFERSNLVRLMRVKELLIEAR